MTGPLNPGHLIAPSDKTGRESTPLIGTRLSWILYALRPSLHMQPSALQRRGIVMPHMPEVIQRINDWDVDESTMVDYLPITDESLFLQLWDIGLFAKINRACGTLIDDYEEEWLPSDKLTVARRLVTQLHRQNQGGAVGDFLLQLSALIADATERQLPLYLNC